jgi:hypothetical protein
VPTTEDEKEDFGDYDREGGGNLARKCPLRPKIVSKERFVTLPLVLGLMACGCGWRGRYIDDTRRRKGLWVEEKIVEKADKQRNRSVRK